MYLVPVLELCAVVYRDQLCVNVDGYLIRCNFDTARPTLKLNSYIFASEFHIVSILQNGDKTKQ